ncbi:MAG TPA: hypothetical protein VMN39_03160, partial [Longimicrobiaceae bacterium]|nr:hypothetical protein [Longimicrobiaceae bacterium]
EAAATMNRFRPLLVAALLSFGTAPGVAQQQGQPGAIRVDLGLTPAEVTVGQPFRTAVRVTAPAGVQIEYGEFVGGDSLQSRAPMEVLATEQGSVAAVYTLVAWVAGAPLVGAVPVRFLEPDGTTRLQSIDLRLPEVASVLPADGSEIAPRPVKDLVIPPGAAGRSWWWLALLLAALAAGLLYAWWKRRGRGSLDESADPREWALAQLAELEIAPPTTPAQIAEIYVRSSAILRGYLVRIEPSLGLDLTTTELQDRMRGLGMAPPLMGELRHILNAADRVKFAAYEPAAADASATIGRIRAWIQEYPAPVEPGIAAERAA